MISKRKFIELVQDRLSGGDATMDVQGKFSYGAIEAVTNIVLSDIVANNRSLAEQFALTSNYSVSENKVLLSIKPILGMKGIIFINSSFGMIPTTMGVGEASIMSIIMPSMTKYAKNIVGNYLFFVGLNTNNPIVNIDLSVVPDFESMDEDDNFIVEANFEVLLRKVMELMQPLSPEEVLDDSVRDTDKGQ